MTKEAIKLKEVLAEVYLDWVNNYLSHSVMAEHYELTVGELNNILTLGREIHESSAKKGK